MKITGSTGIYTGMYDKVSDINEKKDAKNSAAGYSANELNINANTDTTAKNLQSQIADTKKALEKLDKDAQMSAEEKIKKKQELDRKLSELTSQLRQHQLEKAQQKKEKEQDTSNNPEPLQSPGKDTEKSAEKNMPGSKSMEMLISAQSGIGMSRIHSRVAEDLTGRVKVISAEISTDRMRGTDVTFKEEEREKLLRKADKASDSQMKDLHGVFNDVKKASLAEAEKDTKNKDDDGKVILKVAGTSSEERKNKGGKRTDGYIIN